MSSIESVYREIETTKPKLVFLNGKTSTGKTTLSNALREKYSCSVIELDTIVDSLKADPGVNKYIEAYQKRDDLEFTICFVNTVKQKIQNHINDHSFVLIEGAVANNDTLSEIINDWASSFLFIYLDIKNIEVYIKRLTKRFKGSSEANRNSLPVLFYEKFKAEDLKKYYKDRIITPAIEGAIKAYAIDSMKVSQSRLDAFSSQFNHILKVEV